MKDPAMFLHDIKVYILVNLKIIEEMEKQLDKPSSAGVILRDLKRRFEEYEYG